MPVHYILAQAEGLATVSHFDVAEADAEGLVTGLLCVCMCVCKFASVDIYDRGRLGDRYILRCC